MDRKELRETTALVLLGLVSLVGGLGHGLHALLGCTHAPAYAGQGGTASFGLSAVDVGENVDPAATPDRGDTGQRRRFDCPLCTLLARFRATPPASLVAPAAVALVARQSVEAAPIVVETWTESCRPRGPPSHSAVA